ncbi:MAG: NUDIX hydrolase [Actinobacteria bacterium]|nr:NUDIX hydrolase [Actinomycetota bacterium]
MKALYCSQCGGAVEERVIADRIREVCTVCDTIFYQNPLPAAAALVLDAGRRVLLVKRKYPPSEGMWCLPIGFAEMGETIASAALRELGEETGVAGRILRLIDADSWSGKYYGDLLVVTFEVEKTGGAETPGDDASDVAYFPIDQLPPLAFPSNEKAIRLCADLHRDEWAIHDSFHRLEQGSGAEMLSDTLVGFVSEHADYVARLWLADVRSNRTSKGYWSLNTDQLLAECSSGLKLLGRWLEGESTEEQIRKFYRELGVRRQSQGIQLYEMLSAIMLLKKQIWSYALSQGLWERPVEMYRIMELQSRFAVFFDKAMYDSARGYAD